MLRLHGMDFSPRQAAQMNLSWTNIQAELRDMARAGTIKPKSENLADQAKQVARRHMPMKLKHVTAFDMRATATVAIAEAKAQDTEKTLRASLLKIGNLWPGDDRALDTAVEVAKRRYDALLELEKECGEDYVKFFEQMRERIEKLKRLLEEKPRSEEIFAAVWGVRPPWT